MIIKNINPTKQNTYIIRKSNLKFLFELLIHLKFIQNETIMKNTVSHNFKLNRNYSMRTNTCA